MGLCGDVSQRYCCVGQPLLLSADPRLRAAGLARAADLRDWLAQRYEDAVAAAAANTPQHIGRWQPVLNGVATDTQ